MHTSVKLEDQGFVEVEMRNAEMGVKYVMDGEVGWTPVVRRRRKKSEESESSGNLNMNNVDIQEGGRDPMNLYP